MKHHVFLPGLEDAGLPDVATRLLRAHGIGTCAQLYDRLERCWREEQARQVFGRGLEEARVYFGQAVGQVLPGAVRAALARPAFTLPPLTGIHGPASTSERLMTRRARRRAERQQVVAALRRLAAKENLPTRMLLTDWMTAVGDQGYLGSCTGWASTANREFLAQQEPLAPLFAYALAKHLDGCPDVQGSWQHFCFEGFARFGHLREDDYPYTDHPDGLPVEPYVEPAAEFRAPTAALRTCCSIPQTWRCNLCFSRRSWRVASPTSLVRSPLVPRWPSMNRGTRLRQPSTASSPSPCRASASSAGMPCASLATSMRPTLMVSSASTTLLSRTPGAQTGHLTTRLICPATL